MLTVFASEATSLVELHSHRSPQNSHQCTLTPTRDCMPGFPFFRQIPMSHQLLPIYTHTSSETLPMTYCCPLSTYMFCMAEGKYEADIVPTIKALVEKKNTTNPMPCYCYYMNNYINYNLMGENCPVFQTPDERF